MQNESDLQNFIAENPWLLNQNYESVPQLPKNGMEVPVGDQQRVDLVLRDKVHKVPVVVEFKFGSMIRENIGQLLEYRARVTASFGQAPSILHEVFGDFLLVPRLVLVVRQCDDFFRVACNLAGIEVYEYKNMSSIFSDPSKVKTIRNFTESFKREQVPLTLERGAKIDELVYRPIRKVLEKHNQPDAWFEPRESSGFFYPQYTSLFVNRWLFKSEPVSIGLFEEFLSETHTICLSYYSTNKTIFEKFCQSYKEKYGLEEESQWHEAWNEGYLRRVFVPNDFFSSAATLFENELLRYLAIREASGWR